MYNTLNTLSPEEKLARYRELNSTPSDASYASFTPTAGAAKQTENTPFPDIDFTGMVQDKLPVNILAPSKTLPKTEDATEDEDDPYGQFKLMFPKEKAVNGPYKTQGVNDRAKDAYKYYVNVHKLPPHVAAGIVGNLYQESRLKPTAVEQGNTKAGRGIAQWDKNDRWPSLEKWAKSHGKDPLDVKTQLDYVLVEPGWGDEALKRTLGTKTAADAAMVFGKFFERPSEKYAEWNIRTGVADTLSNLPII